MSRLILQEVRRMALGEYIDLIEWFNFMKRKLGLKESSSDDGIGDKTGISRLGDANILDNIGLTLILSTAVFITLIALIFVLYLLSKWCCRSSKMQNCLMKVKGYLFWKPFIRYSLLNSLKFNIVAMSAFAGFEAVTAED